jgi:hypothetical protein
VQMPRPLCQPCAVPCRAVPCRAGHSDGNPPVTLWQRTQTGRTAPVSVGHIYVHESRTHGSGSLDAEPFKGHSLLDAVHSL